MYRWSCRKSPLYLLTVTYYIHIFKMLIYRFVYQSFHGYNNTLVI